MVKELRDAVGTITTAQINFVQESTLSKSASEQWFIQRKNRVTASKFHLIVKKVNDDLSVINQLK